MKVYSDQIIKKWYETEYSNLYDIKEKSIYGNITEPVLKLHQELLNLKKSKSHPLKVIELGCGDGRNIIPLFNDRDEIHGLDITPHKSLSDIGIIVHNDSIINFHRNMGMFDVIICSEVLQMIPRIHTKDILLSIRESLNDGGMCYVNMLSDINRYHIESNDIFYWNDEPRYSVEESNLILDDIFNGMNIIESGEFFDSGVWPLGDNKSPIEPYYWEGYYVYRLLSK